MAKSWKAQSPPRSSRQFLTVRCATPESPALRNLLQAPQSEIMSNMSNRTSYLAVKNVSSRWLRVAPAALVLLALSMGVTIGCTRKTAGDDVMARINGRKILRTEVEKYYRNQTEGASQPPSVEQADSLRLSILKELIDNEILMQRAEKLGLLATDEEVESKLNEIRAPYTKEEFDQRLKERAITIDDFKRDLRRSLTIEKVVNKEITSK